MDPLHLLPLSLSILSNPCTNTCPGVTTTASTNNAGPGVATLPQLHPVNSSNHFESETFTLPPFFLLSWMSPFPYPSLPMPPIETPVVF